MRNENGFTLIEMMVVVTVVGLMFALGAPAMQWLLSSNFDEETRNEMGRIREGLFLYFEQNGSFPASLGALTVDIADAEFKGAYLNAGNDASGNSTGKLLDEWGTEYAIVTNSGSKVTIRSLGPNRQNESGGGDDIDLAVDASHLLAEDSRRELGDIRSAIAAYNRDHLPQKPLPSNILDLIDILQDHQYLPPGNGYLTDGWGRPYQPGPSPVESIDINSDPSATLPESTGGLVKEPFIFVCHRSQGMAGATHDMEVPQSLVQLHLDHGDALGGCCHTLNFDTEDDFWTALANGQKITSPPEFGNEVEISYSGPSFGPAIFDSTIGGANDPGRDSDLLVDLGNILILQEEDCFVAADIYSHPDDDARGGTFIFDFTRNVQCQSITLIDIDSGNQGVSVVLTDCEARTRTYTVPGGFTEDIASQGPPGYRVLDLTTLASQAGFAATATEMADFDPQCVVKMTVTVASSAGLDNLEYCPME